MSYMGWNIHLPPANWFTLQSPELEGLVREAMDQKVIAIDTETTGLVIHHDFAIYWSLCWGEKRMCMPASTLTAFKQVFADPTKDWVFANAKFDCHMLANLGIEIKGRLVDTAVMHALLYEESSHALKDMAKQILGWKWQDFFDTFKAKNLLDTVTQMKRKETIQELLVRTEKEDLGSLVEYASNDAYGTMRLYEALKKELENSPTYSLYPNTYATLADLFFKTEVPFTKVLYTCERNGILIDTSYLASVEGPALSELANIERDIVHHAGRAINPNSPMQLQNYFFKEKGYRPVKLSKGGKSGVRNPSTDSDVLDVLAAVDPVAKLLLEHRELSKLIGTYVKGLQSRTDPNGRIHTRFNQDVARTGRLSSSDPNLQNIPKPDSDKFKLRGAFVARPGYELIVVDYEQLEMRLLASAALEQGMIDLFKTGKDIHMGNAAMVFGKKFGITYDDIVAAKKIEKKVNNNELGEEAMTAMVKNGLYARQAAKAIGFGLNYGMKENKLARQLGCTPEEAKEMIAEYMGTYPAVSQFYAEAIAEAQATGYAHTLLGRRRYLPEIHALSEMERWGAERKAVNTQIQGTAADACRLAMLHCYNSRMDLTLGCDMLLQVHDELVFECPKENVEEAKSIIKDCMEHPFQTDLAVALDISMGTGPSWMAAK